MSTSADGIEVDLSAVQGTSGVPDEPTSDLCETVGCQNTFVGNGRCEECCDVTPVPVRDSYEAVDWSKTKGGRIPRVLNDRRQWMGAIVTDDNQKKPFAPWESPDHPDSDGETDARWKWGLSDNYVDGNRLDDELEQSSAIEHRAFIQQDDDPNAHVDFDDVVDPETEEVHPSVAGILDQLGLTFVERSQSGSGIHASYHGELPDEVRQVGWDLDDEPFGANEDVPSVEIYDHKRLLVVTGTHVRGTPAGVHQWDDDGLLQLLIENDQLVENGVSTPSDEYEDFDASEYEPEVTGHDETTEIRDVFAAIDRLNTQHVAEKTIVHSWNDSASTSDRARAFYPTWGPNSNGTANYVDEEIWNDTGGGGYGGPVVMALIDTGELRPKNATPVQGELWWKGVNHLRELGFEIPEFVEDENTTPIPEPRLCDPPKLKDRVPFDAAEERRKLEDEEYETFVGSSQPVVWAHPCGWGKTTSGALGGHKRDRKVAMAFPTHQKAHEFVNDDVTPDTILHLKGGSQPRESVCMNWNDHRCPEHDDHQCPLMCPLFERDKDDQVRQRFEQLKEVMGPIAAHNEVDPHTGEKCEWLAQYDELESHDMVACVHEHQAIKKLRDEWDNLVDESTRLLETKHTASVEELLNTADTLETLSGLDSNYGELATFARRLAKSVRRDDEPTTDPPSIDWIADTEVMKAETLSSIRIRFNEHLRSRVGNGDDPPAKPGVIDVLIGFAASCGLDTDACGRALAGVKALHRCPRCESRLSNQDGRRVCEHDECGWTEGANRYLPSDAERARFVTDKDTTPSGHSEAVIKSLPNKSELPDAPLLLDATATPKKVKGLYGREPTVVGDDHDVKMNMDVTQITDGAYHGSSFRQSNTLIERFQVIIDRACREYDRPLFGGKRDVLKQFEFADNAVTENYGGLRGLNYDDCDAVFALGAPHWDVGALERDAELLSGGIAVDNEIEVGGVEYSNRRDNGELVANPPEYRRLQYVDDDDRGLEIPVKEFSGLVGDLFYEKREHELEQLVHRTRPITSDTTIDVYLLTNVPTDIPVDEVTELDILVERAKGRSKDAAQLDVPAGAKDLVESMDADETFTRNDLCERADASESTVKRWVSSLKDEGAIEHTGEKRQRSEVLTTGN